MTHVLRSFAVALSLSLFPAFIAGILVTVFAYRWAFDVIGDAICPTKTEPKVWVRLSYSRGSQGRTPMLTCKGVNGRRDVERSLAAYGIAFGAVYLMFLVPAIPTTHLVLRHRERRRARRTAP